MIFFCFFFFSPSSPFLIPSEDRPPSPLASDDILFYPFARLSPLWLSHPSQADTDTLACYGALFSVEEIANFPPPPLLVWIVNTMLISFLFVSEMMLIGAKTSTLFFRDNELFIPSPCCPPNFHSLSLVVSLLSSLGLCVLVFFF